MDASVDCGSIRRVDAVSQHTVQFIGRRVADCAHKTANSVNKTDTNTVDRWGVESD